MDRGDPAIEVSRRLRGARSSLGPDVGDAAAHACRVAIGKAVLKHAEDRALNWADNGRHNASDGHRTNSRISLAFDYTNLDVAIFLKGERNTIRRLSEALQPLTL